MKDRTYEFQTTVETFLNQSAHGEPLLRASSSARKKGFYSEFSRKAYEINTAIQQVLTKLEKLTRLAKSRTIFDDRPVEVQELTHVIKADLAKLNGQILELQRIQKGTHPTLTRVPATAIMSPNKSFEEHNNHVMLSLQSRLADASSAFTQVLEARSQNIKAQKDRRDQFNAASVIPLLNETGSPTSPTLGGPRQRTATKELQPHVAIDVGNPQSLQQLTMASSSTADSAYLESRNTALLGIETTINEIGAIYQQLSAMISEQGDLVQRIDTNIEQMSWNVERGQGELMRYLRNVGSNRWLMIKMFAILIVFVVLYSIIF